MGRAEGKATGLPVPLSVDAGVRDSLSLGAALPVSVPVEDPDTGGVAVTLPVDDAVAVAGAEPLGVTVVESEPLREPENEAGDGDSETERLGVVVAGAEPLDVTDAGIEPLSEGVAGVEPLGVIDAGEALAVRDLGELLGVGGATRRKVKRQPAGAEGATHRARLVPEPKGLRLNCRFKSKAPRSAVLAGISMGTGY